MRLIMDNNDRADINTSVFNISLINEHEYNDTGLCEMFKQSHTNSNYLQQFNLLDIALTNSYGTLSYIDIGT